MSTREGLKKEKTLDISCEKFICSLAMILEQIMLIAVIVLLFVAAIFIIFPQALLAYKRWRANHSAADFSNAVLLFFTGFGLVAFVYVVMVQVLLKGCIDKERLLFYFAFVLLTQKLLLPKALHYFKKWRTSDKSIDFSWMFLYAFFSFYLISFMFISLFESAARVFCHVP